MSRKPLTKGKNKGFFFFFFFRSGHLLWQRDGERTACVLCPLPLLPLGSREDKTLHRTDYLTDADQKIPNWSIKITFLVEIETAIKLGV